MTAGEIDERFQHTWPTTSRHLRVLERAGLLVHEKRGRTRVFSVNHEKLDVVKEWLEWFGSNGPGAAQANPTGETETKRSSPRPMVKN
jgi:DNA-binding transcriptional ArsR family regulator